jgi:methyl-accepting chemotaxis protein
MVSVVQKPAVVDPQSKLAQKRKNFASQMNTLLKEGGELGATEGMQRLELICEQHDQLSPNTAYLWIDPNSIQMEIEEAQTRTFKMEFVHFCRNFFSLAPLITTWVALFIAVYSYQQDLSNYPEDRTIPFLQLWQGGFHSVTWLTFTAAAGTDVVLLILFLISILLTHDIERRAHLKAVTFVQKLQHEVDDLMKFIAEDGFKHIGDQSDIDKVVDAVKKVVDSATASVKQAVDGTTASLKQVVEQSANANKKVIEDSANANKQVLEGVEKSFKSAIVDAQQKMQQAMDASKDAMTTSNAKVEKMFTDDVAPLMKSFRTDMGTFQKELGKYQTRLNDLTSASQQLAGASQKLSVASEELTKNAERYITIGNNIDAQIASLNMTQREVVSQIGSVASNISTAAGQMSSVTGSMKNATTHVEIVAKQLNVEMQTSLQKMTTNVDGFSQSMYQSASHLNSIIQQFGANVDNVSRSVDTVSRSLGQVGADLRSTSEHLYNTARYLEATQHSNTTLIHRLFGRRRKQPMP